MGDLFIVPLVVVIIWCLCKIFTYEETQPHKSAVDELKEALDEYDKFAKEYDVKLKQMEEKFNEQIQWKIL